MIDCRGRLHHDKQVGTNSLFANRVGTFSVAELGLEQNVSLLKCEEGVADGRSSHTLGLQEEVGVCIPNRRSAVGHDLPRVVRQKQRKHLRIVTWLWWIEHPTEAKYWLHPRALMQGNDDRAVQPHKNVSFFKMACLMKPKTQCCHSAYIAMSAHAHTGAV